MNRRNALQLIGSSAAFLTLPSYLLSNQTQKSKESTHLFFSKKDIPRIKQNSKTPLLKNNFQEILNVDLKEYESFVHENANTNDFQKFVQLVNNNKSTDAPQQTQHTQATHNPRVFDYSQTKSNLNTYLKRIKNDGFSDKRLDGVSRYVSALVAAGYMVQIGEDGRAIVDEKNSPTLPVNSSCEIKYHDNRVDVFYSK